MSKIRIWSDGAATMKQIDGKYTRCNGGSAMAAFDENDKIIFLDSKGFKNTTNNYCELYAIYMALNYFSSNYSKDDTLEIHSDSAYCVNMLKENGWIYSWVKNGWTRGKKHEPIENLEIIQKIWDIMQGVNVTFIKVKGHTGNNDFNDLVDKLAVKIKEEMSQ